METFDIEIEKRKQGGKNVFECLFSYFVQFVCCLQRWEMEVMDNIFLDLVFLPH